MTRLLDAQPAQPEASCKVLLDGLLSALSHLAGLRIIHRDALDLDSIPELKATKELSIYVVVDFDVFV